jgi:hypothetical protein
VGALPLARASETLRVHGITARGLRGARAPAHDLPRTQARIVEDAVRSEPSGQALLLDDRTPEHSRELMMPVMTGWQVLEVLRQNDALAALPVVVVSAASSACEPPEGARRCVPKPIHRGNVLAAVEEHRASSPGG